MSTYEQTMKTYKAGFKRFVLSGIDTNLITFWNEIRMLISRWKFDILIDSTMMFKKIQQIKTNIINFD